MVVDDSLVVRTALKEVLSQDPNIEVIATATDPIDALEKLKHHRPDVITLDIEMPKMDGLSFLRKLMKEDPLPVVMCSTLTGRGAKASLEALELGAVDIVQKPKQLASAFFQREQDRIREVIKGAAQAQVKRKASPEVPVTPLPRDASAARPEPSKAIDDRLIVIGASTGGTEALRTVLASMGSNPPPIAIVQHMPAAFTEAFAQRLDARLAPKITEAVHGQPIAPGEVVIAPGDRHLLVRWSGAGFEVELRDGPLISRHRPSVDVLFRSAAHGAGNRVVAAILTGMGRDGARGMADLHKAGAFTVAQDQASSVVFGMPGAAIESGGVQEVLPLERIGPRLLELCERPVSAKIAS